MLPSRLLLVQFLRLYTISPLSPQLSGGVSINSRLHLLRHFSSYQLLSHSNPHRSFSYSNSLRRYHNHNNNHNGGYSSSHSQKGTLFRFVHYWRTLLCAVTLFVWDRERITDREIERYYDNYKQQYMKGNETDKEEEEEEDERQPAIIPLHDVSRSDVKGAFIEQEERKRQSSKESLSSSSSSRSSSKSEDSNSEAGDDSSKETSNSFSSSSLSSSLTDSTPDDVKEDNILKSNNGAASTFWSKVVKNGSEMYSYLKSFFPSTPTLSKEEGAAKDTSISQRRQKKMDGEENKRTRSHIPLECAEVTSSLSDESDEEYHSLDESEAAVTTIRSSKTTTTTQVMFKEKEERGEASDEIIETPWRAVKTSHNNDLTHEDQIKADGWEFMLEQDGCKVYTKPYKDTGLLQYRVIGSYDDITARDFLDVQTNNNYRKVWDTYAIKLDTIETDAKTGTEVVYWLLYYPFPLSNRDYVFVRRAWISDNNDAIVIISRSVEHPSIPENKKYVRVKTYFSEMVIKPHTFIDELGFHYDLTYFDDPGTYMPSSAVSWASKSALPDFLSKVHTATLRRASYSQQQDHKEATVQLTSSTLRKASSSYSQQQQHKEAAVQLTSSSNH